jgi:hypothetical protein
MQTTIWIAYNADNDCAVSLDDHDTALQDLMDNYGPCGGTRVVEMKVTLPDVKPTVVEAVIPDTDGPVTVTIA